jgi:mono/diheme cytochrome c family protein
MRFFWGAVVALVVLALGGLAVVWTGAYNVAATDPHWGPVRWALSTTMANSVRARADAEAAGPFEGAQAEQGFKAFDAMCVQCHGAPGVKPDPWAKGLRPDPPDLSEHAGHWNRAELFWIVKHGIKMSAMPGLAPTHEDAEIRNIALFVERLPEMSADDYAARRSAAAAPGPSEAPSEEE